MTIRAGRLNKRVTFSKMFDEYDSFGELTKATIPIGTLWAEVLDRESLVSEGDFKQSQSVIKITVRYNRMIDITSPDRLKTEYNGKTYTTTSILNPRMANETLVIEAVNRG